MTPGPHRATVPPVKHIIFVHGRSTKPAEKEKERLVRTALIHGIERLNPGAAEQLRTGHVGFTVAYYGDVTNRLMRRSDASAWTWMTAKDPDHENSPCEDGKYYDASMAEALARPTSSFSKADYRRWLDEVPDARGSDEIARIASGMAAFFGLSDELIRRTAPDMASYLKSLVVASEIRDRLQAPLVRALREGHEVCLLAHSMGCIVAYDVLWRLSRLAEYRDLGDFCVSLWLTLGNPLGEPGVKANLIDVDEKSSARYPKDIIGDWVNIPAHDDFICHDRTVADDFAVMRRRGYVRSIEDREPIYSFWRGGRGSNPHKLYGYLNHPRVGAELGRWIVE